jgi:hypothetical protein
MGWPRRSDIDISHIRILRALLSLPRATCIFAVNRSLRMRVSVPGSRRCGPIIARGNRRRFPVRGPCSQRGVLAKYGVHVTSALLGAVTDANFVPDSRCSGRTGSRVFLPPCVVIGPVFITLVA